MSRPIPILYTIPNFISAGSGRAMLNIVQRLDRERFAPAVCVARKGGALDQEVEALGIPFLEAPFTVAPRPLYRLPSLARNAASAFSQFRFRLWHSFNYLDDYSEPIIARQAGARRWIYTKKNMNWNRRSWVLRTLLASRIVAQNSTMMQSFFASSRGRRKARLVPPGVDTQTFLPMASSRLNLRSQLAISDASTVVACVAHLVPVKGHPTLLKAVARVPEMQLLIAGRPQDKQYANDLAALARDLEISDRVHFLGPVSDVPSLWAEADICALPTERHGEGCPVALLEARACGKPCVATDVPGSKDVLAEGTQRILVPPKDLSALAEALRRLAQYASLRAELGRGARDLALHRYSIEREVADHQDLYAEVLRG